MYYMEMMSQATGKWVRIDGFESEEEAVRVAKSQADYSRTPCRVVTNTVRSVHEPK